MDDASMWTRDKWVEHYLKRYPGSNPKVLGFIFDIVNHQLTVEGSEAIETLFSSGYCYHFAVILKNLFGGEIMWHKYHGHIVWYESDTQICYDVHGVFIDYTEQDIVPISILGDKGLEGFLHRGDDKKYSTDEITSYVQARVNEYEKKMGWEITTNPYAKNNFEERVTEECEDCTRLFD